MFLNNDGSFNVSLDLLGARKSRWATSLRSNTRADLHPNVSVTEFLFQRQKTWTCRLPTAPEGNTGAWTLRWAC